MAETLTALEGTFLELEEASDGALMHIGSVVVFEPPAGAPPPSLEVVRDLVADRLQALPRFRCRISSERTARWAWPRWIEDARFTVNDHVLRAALPAPGGERELREWIGDYYSHRLDRSRPVWELVLVEGLENGRWALAQKLHHCLVDGVGSPGIIDLLLDDRPAVPEPGPTAPGPRPDLAPSDLLPLPSPPQPIVQATRAGARAVAATLRATLRPHETLARSRMLAELILADELIAAPRCSLNGPIGAARRYATVACRLDEVQAIRAAFGGSVNDAGLAICASGLRRLLIERGEQPPAAGLRAMVPVDLRGASEHLTLGNSVGSLFLALPVAEPVAVARHRRIVEAMRQLRESGAAEASAAIVDLGSVAPPLVHASLARLLLGTRLFNITIANVQRPPTARYAFGARMREVDPIVPLAAEHTLAIAVVSHDGELTFGVNADRESTPDLDVLATGMREGIGDLLASIRHPRHPRHSPVVSTPT